MKKQFDIEKDARTTGVLSVDMVSTCILFYRRRQRALKAIYLKPALYASFRLWVILNVGSEAVEGRQLEYDGVNIEAGSMFQSKSLVVDFWEEK